MSSREQSEHTFVEGVVVRVWDLPVRIVHWTLAVLFTFSWISGTNGWLEWHKVSGYAIVSLVVFRILWGFYGSHTARFASFVREPTAVLRYICSARDRTLLREQVGHNPLGGWNVIALLGLLLAQGGLGLFAVDLDGLESGPWAVYVSFEVGRLIASLHELVANVLLVLIGLHLAAVVLHLVYYRDDLITPMVTGIKRIPHVHQTSQDS